MKSYMVYLTKSKEAAKRIELSFSGEFKTDDIESVEYCIADGDDRIPQIYHNKGYHCCVVTLLEYGEDNTPTYELTIC